VVSLNLADPVRRCECNESLRVCRFNFSHLLADRT